MNVRPWWRLYRILAVQDGSAGAHRGMTALTKDEWRAISKRRLSIVMDMTS